VSASYLLIISDQSVMLYLAYAWNLFSRPQPDGNVAFLDTPLSCTMVNQKAYALLFLGDSQMATWHFALLVLLYLALW
jgi:hypothetical protein